MIDGKQLVRVRPLDSWAVGEEISLPGYGLIRHPLFGQEKSVPLWVANFLLAKKKIRPFEGATPLPEPVPVVNSVPEVVAEAVAAVVETTTETVEEAIAEMAEEVTVSETEGVAQEELEGWQSAFLFFLNENSVEELKSQLKGHGIGERVINTLKKKEETLVWGDVTDALNPRQLEFAKTFAESHLS